ncbi:unnamed protein product [Sphenostylis stenocarpa]|uniref:Uncharacterized protein n=1 Tax=Sphenostylis stenocarpa TaxID=92480 RepID=A0AA86TE36_9FABA|nr:unnamed protein product [Sphenostylis stenocarpa]
MSETTTLLETNKGKASQIQQLCFLHIVHTHASVIQCWRRLRHRRLSLLGKDFKGLTNLATVSLSLCTLLLP